MQEAQMRKDQEKRRKFEEDLAEERKIKSQLGQLQD